VGPVLDRVERAVQRRSESVRVGDPFRVTPHPGHSPGVVRPWVEPDEGVVEEVGVVVLVVDGVGDRLPAAVVVDDPRVGYPARLDHLDRRHGVPQDERAVADRRDDRAVRSGEVDPDGGPERPPEAAEQYE